MINIGYPKYWMVAASVDSEIVSFSIRITKWDPRLFGTVPPSAAWEPSVKAGHKFMN